jgi:hypothetical protein
VTHNERRDQIGEAMKSKGFWDDGTGEVDGTLLRLSLAQTEVCEAIQEVKRFWGKDGVNMEQVKDRVVEELADTAIRLYDVAAFDKMDLAESATRNPDTCGPTERIRLIVSLGALCEVISNAYRWRLYPENLRNNWQNCVWRSIEFCRGICQQIGRDLYAAIDAKMKVNMARNHKYGTPDEVKS